MIAAWARNFPALKGLNLMVGIVCDSACDLPVEIIRKHDITVLPCHVLLGDKEYLDGVTITPEKIFAYVAEKKELPKTSAPSLLEISDAFTQKLEKYNEVVSISMSNTISSSCQNMRVAAETLDREDVIRVIDSENLSTGMGMLVLECAELAESGATASEIVEKAAELINKIHVTFVVDTLKYLYMGGRCSAVKALAGTTLKLHPCIEMAGGSLHAEKKYRGSTEVCSLKYTDDIIEKLPTAHKKRLCFTYSFLPSSDFLPKVKKKLDETGLFDEIIVTQAGAVISSHCGPDCMGIIYRKE